MAAGFAPTAKRTSRTMGRPAQKGPALPKLKTLLSNPTTSWTKMIASAWYGHAEGKTLEITSDIALWYRPGTPVLPVRWVLVSDPDGKRDPQAFFSTDFTIEPADIIALYVRRWQIEVTFAETRAQHGYHVVVRRSFVQAVAQRIIHCVGERIVFLGSVQRQNKDLTLAASCDFRGHDANARST